MRGHNYFAKLRIFFVLFVGLVFMVSFFVYRGQRQRDYFRKMQWRAVGVITNIYPMIKGSAVIKLKLLNSNKKNIDFPGAGKGYCLVRGDSAIIIQKMNHEWPIGSTVIIDSNIPNISVIFGGKVLFSHELPLIDESQYCDWHKEIFDKFRTYNPAID